MTTSISATELAKLGKCEAMIKVQPDGAKKPFRARSKVQGVSAGNERSKLGEEAHKRFEGRSERFMAAGSKSKQRFYQAIFFAVVACGAALLVTIKAFV